MADRNGHPPFWGLSLSLAAGARVLVVDDRPDERRPILKRLLGEAQATWAADVGQVRAALESHGSFDVYCLDYDLGQERGGWLAAARLIRERDPRSIAKLVLIHSANTDARAYFSLFPAAIFIQWDVLATLLGVPLVDDEFIDRVLDEAGHEATVEQLRQAALIIRHRQSRQTR
jgi:CheY-like chemotaxis protein